MAKIPFFLLLTSLYFYVEAGQADSKSLKMLDVYDQKNAHIYLSYLIG